MENLARTLMIVGLLLVGMGGLVFLLVRTGFPLGHLPGDLRIQTENFTCVFPVVTGILLSILLTILINIVIWLVNR